MYSKLITRTPGEWGAEDVCNNISHEVPFERSSNAISQAIGEVHATNSKPG